MTKYAVITINIGKRYSKMASMTIPTHKAYAEKIGAEFVEIKEFNLPFINSEYSAYWAKFRLYKQLDKYERIVFLDLDTVVQKNCPNLLELIPEDQFAVLHETDYGIDQSVEIDDMLQKMPEVKWDKDYFNVGVMVFSRCHKPAFELSKESKGGLMYPEQTLLNYNVKKLGFKVYHLPIKFNHMLFLNQNPAERASSYIIHYAGLSSEIKDILIEDDLEKFENGGVLITANNLPAFISEKISDKSSADSFRGKLYKNHEIGLDPEI